MPVCAPAFVGCACFGLASRLVAKDLATTTERQLFVALFVALVYVDVRRLPFYATLIIKLAIFAAVYSAVLIGLHLYPAIA